MRMRAALLALILVLWALLTQRPATAQALRLPAAPDVAFEPALGARLPLDAMLRDQQGRSAPLGHWFGGAPVVLVPGYYHCSHLCGTLFEGVLQSLALSGLAAGEVRLLGVSIDPREGDAAARARFQAYAGLMPGGEAGLAMLRGEAGALVRIQQALGYRAVPDAGDQIAHAAGFVVVAPDGRISRFFPGVRFDPAALRAAVLAARGATVAAPAPAGFSERLALLCAHFDPAAGRHTEAALAAVRAGAVLLALGLAAWIWRRRARGGRR